MNWMSELFFDAGNARLALAFLAGAGWLAYQGARELRRGLWDDFDDVGGIPPRVFFFTLPLRAHARFEQGARTRALVRGGARCGTG